MDEDVRIKLDDLVLTPEYQRLTQKQRLWIATYIAGGMLDGNYDPIAATRTAYECKTPEVARIMSYSVMMNMRIIEVLNRHFNKAPIEEFLTLLDRAIHNKKVTIAQVNALKLKADILGFGSRIPNKQAFDGVPLDVKADSKARRKAKRQAQRKAHPPKTQQPLEKTEYGFD